jgi:hypothetical protein
MMLLHGCSKVVDNDDPCGNDSNDYDHDGSDDDDIDLYIIIIIVP